MANLRSLRNRIKSVGSTQKITKAMKMIAAARFRRFQAKLLQSRPFLSELESLIQAVSRTQSEYRDPLSQPRRIQKKLLVVLSSDRGLCGSFNSGLFRFMEKELSSNPSSEIVLVGKKANSFFQRRSYPIFQTVKSFWEFYSFSTIQSFAKTLSEAFLSGQVDQVEIVFNEFFSVMKYQPKKTQLLPLSFEKDPGFLPPKENLPYLTEPSALEVLRALLPRWLETQLYGFGLNSLASEYGARMTAMDSATRNAKEMMDRLTLSMNRARQAAITNDLVEITSGAEAIHQGA